MQTETIYHDNGSMNLFVQFSKCLSALPFVQEEKENEGFKALRARILASMHKVLDDMKLPKNDTTKIENEAHAAMVPNVGMLFMQEMHALLSVLVEQFGPDARAKIEAAIEDSTDNFTTKLQTKYPSANS